MSVPPSSSFVQEEVCHRLSSSRFFTGDCTFSHLFNVTCVMSVLYMVARDVVHDCIFL